MFCVAGGLELIAFTRNATITASRHHIYAACAPYVMSIFALPIMRNHDRASAPLRQVAAALTCAGLHQPLALGQARAALIAQNNPAGIQ